MDQRARGILGALAFSLTAATQSQPAGDRVQAAAWMDEGARLLAQRTPESLRDAAARYRQALGAWLALGDRHRTVDVELELATVHFRLGELAEAQQQLEQATETARADGDPVLQATVLASSALFHEATADAPRALQEAVAAAERFRTAGRGADEALARMTQGRLDGKLNPPPAAVADFERAAESFHAAGQVQGEASALLAAGQFNLLRDDTPGFEKAVEQLARAVPLFEAAADGNDQAFALLSLGTANDRLRRRTEALAAYRRALPLFAASKDIARRATTLLDIAQDERALGDLDAARADFEQALPLLAAAGNAGGRALALTQLASTQEALGDGAAALRGYELAAAAWGAVADPGMQATTRSMAAGLHMSRQEWHEALSAFELALQGAEQGGEPVSQAAALVSIATVQRRLGHAEAALHAATRAVSLLQDDAHAAERALALLIAGSAAADLHDYGTAQADLEQALALGNVNPGARAGALAVLGEIRTELGEQDQALVLLHQALAIDLERHDQGAANKVRLGIANAYAAMGRVQDAQAAYEDVLESERASGELQQQAATLDQLATLLLSFGEAARVVELEQQAVAAARAAGDPDVEASAMSTLGLAWHALGDESKAVELLEAAVVFAHGSGNRRREALCLNNLALQAGESGDPQRALTLYEASRSAFDAASDPGNAATALNNIGGVYRSLGASDRARAYYEQALTLREASHDDQGRSVALNNLAVLAQTDGNPREALRRYAEAYELALRVGNRPIQVQMLSGMALANSSIGEGPKAIGQLQQSLALAREASLPHGEALALHNLATEYERQAEPIRALDGMRQALSRWRLLGSREGESTALVVVARLLASQGRLDEALQTVDEAIASYESQRTRVDALDLRASAFARSGAAYSLRIDILMRLDALHPGTGRDAQAFETSERARARSLIDLLADSHANLRQGVDPGQAAQLRTMDHALDAKGVQRNLLAPASAQLMALDHEIDDLVAAREQLDARIRAANPAYASLTRPRALALPELQALLGPDTLLLEYALGEQRSHLWAVTTDGLHSYPLPPRADIERAVSDFRRALAEVANPRRFDAASAELGAILLGPVVGELRGRRIVVVADAALQAAVPFAALTVPGRGRLVVLDHEVVEEPSLSALAALRAKTTARTAARRVPARGRVAVFADAVFSADDSRLRDRRSMPQGALPAPIAAATRSVGAGTVLARLPKTRDEATRIVALAGAGAMARYGFDATKQAFESPALADYRIIHIATHGLLDARHPELSGLVFSLFQRDGTPSDGYLRLGEVYTLSLTAELVVLSACDSGQGRQVGGEGLIGLTRGFFYAGAASVAASLWEVDDAATEELMVDFYRGMLGPERLRPSAAMRRAQAVMIRSGTKRHPWYWASFVVQGDWR